MSESWDDYADSWDSNKSVIEYRDLAYDALMATVDIKGAKILDFGCGTGLLTEKLCELASDIVAIDPSEKMIAIVNNKKLSNKSLDNVTAIKSELTSDIIAQHETLRTGFDVIVASSALAFVPDYEHTLNLLKPLLRKGGVLVQWDWLKTESEPGMGFSIETLKTAYASAGFSEFTTSIPFSMEEMKVVMGVAKND